jgi:hypothetical protein
MVVLGCWLLLQEGVEDKELPPPPPPAGDSAAGGWLGTWRASLRARHASPGPGRTDRRMARPACDDLAALFLCLYRKKTVFPFIYPFYRYYYYYAITDK